MRELNLFAIYLFMSETSSNIFISFGKISDRIHNASLSYSLNETATIHLSVK